jgi:hypothetical protein
MGRNQMRFYSHCYIYTLYLQPQFCIVMQIDWGTTSLELAGIPDLNRPELDAASLLMAGLESY